MPPILQFAYAARKAVSHLFLYAILLGYLPYCQTAGVSPMTNRKWKISPFVHCALWCCYLCSVLFCVFGGMYFMWLTHHPDQSTMLLTNSGR
jgi:hypothetical protein